MINYVRLCVIALLLIVTAAGRARADTDYLCLNQCVASGKGSMACLKSCEVPSALPSQKAQKTHRQFGSPEVVDGKLFLKPKAIKPAQNPSPVCMQACLRPGITYAYCKGQCLAEATK